MGQWRGPDGILVEAIILDDRPLLRVTHNVGGRTYLRGYCHNVTELHRHGVDLAQLVEDGPLDHPDTPGQP
ncbi:hypothetical protein Nocox_15545 [Nonomuraea coxensis DSM 45129]|uniref:Transposase n=1 Tax=Nonomuraea coxensis DSM 45129 TaxID=1122611 RepID=A0ABX8U1U6_9ACTN|nr:hypothetical protein [Nonomuraea coxensis]QYC40724.1 hypothetical protein Nocox_15545 [Nonomuraea coxensis DSM 45129]